MKRIGFFICFALISFNISKAQELKPTQKEVLVDVFVGDNFGKALSGETVSFLGRRTKSVYVVKTDNEGKAFILLPKKDVYEVSYKDLLDTKEYAILEVPDESGLFTFNVEITYEPSRVFVLENVYFEFGRSALKPESFPALDELVELLRAEPVMEIEISGHTDNIGTKESNLRLSKDRAEAVRQYLIRNGIAHQRIISTGYGDTLPVTDNDSEEGRQMNRRTEVKILKK